MSDFIEIPAGWFLMGDERGQDDERPVHRVWVDRFEMAAFPVTRPGTPPFSRTLATMRHVTGLVRSSPERISPWSA